MLFSHLKYRRDDIPTQTIYIHIYAYTDLHTCTHIRSYLYINTCTGFLVGSVVKNLPAKAGDTGDAGSIPVLGRSPGGGNGNPFQYFCMGNPMDRGAWNATVHGVIKNQTGLNEHARYAYIH